MRKFIYTLFVSVFLSSVGFGQISMSQLIKVAKMDKETFEIYAMDRGFNFSNLDDHEGVKGLIMLKKSGAYNYELLTSYSKYFKFKYASNYQFSRTDKDRLLSIYKELKALGFKLGNSRVIDGDQDDEDVYRYEKNYERGDESINIYIKSDKVKILYKMFPEF